MSLGKRPRPPSMRRTTSLAELPPALVASDPNPRDRRRLGMEAEALPAIPPAQESLDPLSVQPAEFLRACGRCKRRLGPGVDTFIYRGEAAFCSLECREKQIKLDEMKEKCMLRLLKSKKPESSTPKARSEATGKSETVAAA